MAELREKRGLVTIFLGLLFTSQWSFCTSNVNEIRAVRAENAMLRFLVNHGYDAFEQLDESTTMRFDVTAGKIVSHYRPPHTDPAEDDVLRSSISLAPPQPRLHFKESKAEAHRRISTTSFAEAASFAELGDAVASDTAVDVTADIYFNHKIDIWNMTGLVILSHVGAVLD
eukprot:CAMPEP_0185760592 /NCGR_PEP_ID=MMETSP1174-20130828/19496_1 /TAXON_ID=35687 /ORGANISM="Dictyocha speculum, Strain CCMP1381" /LENGTH=170 /DNA_ID=CAMNT_0028441479 /DNA_START=78 /DNA_END=587 /DNA_ORIENTATION=-